MLDRDFCECLEPGHCPRYLMNMQGRLFQICRGENIDPQEASRYRELWMKMREGGMEVLQKSPETTTAVARTICPHLGDEVIENGAPKLRECPGCRGNVRLKLNYCKHPSREPEEVSHQDCNKCEYRPKIYAKDVRALILKNHLSPGDVTCMSASIHSLHHQHPGKFITAIDTTANAVYEHNPDVSTVEEAQKNNATVLQMHYPLINQSNQRAVHMMQGYCDWLEQNLGVRVPLLTNRPPIYVSYREKTWFSQVREITEQDSKFFLVNAGRKGDFTAKFWGTERFQKVVDILSGKVQFVQVGELQHHHPALHGVIDLRGKTDTRQLVRLVYHCTGVLTGVSFLMHLAAGLEKPAVTIMGGREPVSWNSFPRQQLLHTIGMLSCCREGGCWKSRAEKLNDGAEQDTSLCEKPVNGSPTCMSMIAPEEVAERIWKISQNAS